RARPTEPRQSPGRLRRHPARTGACRNRCRLQCRGAALPGEGASCTVLRVSPAMLSTRPSNRVARIVARTMVAHRRPIREPAEGTLMNVSPGTLTFVLGGARSGKSRHGEQLIAAH